MSIKRARVVKVAQHGSVGVYVHEASDGSTDFVPGTIEAPHVTPARAIRIHALPGPRLRCSLVARPFRVGDGAGPVVQCLREAFHSGDHEFLPSPSSFVTVTDVQIHDGPA